MAVQTVDEILDFTGAGAELGKPAGSDLMQGTLTLPALLLMDRAPDDNPIEKLFREKDGEHLEEALRMVQDSDILEESHKVARDFRDRAVASLERLPDTPERAALAEIADYMVARRS